MRWADNVVEESTTTTTLAYQLGGVPASGEAPGAQTFVAGIGTGQTCYYYAKEVSGTAWERGIGTVTDAATDTLTRTTIHGSSNAGSAVDWTGKTVRVYCVNSAYALRRSTLDHAGLLENATFTVTRSGNAETFHLKTAAGNDPSAADPVRASFVNTTGGFDVLEGTSALSFTFSSGSTGGAIANLEFKVAVLLLNNAGTMEMAVVVRPSGIRDNSIISTTAEGGAGGADSPRVIYSTTARTNVRCRVLGYATYTLATPGTWNTAPSDILLTRAGAVEIQVKELLYQKTLTANGVFDTNEWWPAGTLPNGYDSFEIEGELRGSAAVTSDIAYMFFNGDVTQTDYRRAYLYGGTGAGGSAADDALLGEVCGASSTANMFTHCNGIILAPGNTTRTKGWQAYAGRRQDATVMYSTFCSGDWESTAALNRVQVALDTTMTKAFVAGSNFRLYGNKLMTVLM